MANSNLIDLESAVTAAAQAPYRLRLYTCGITPRSMNAVATVRKICETRLEGRCDLEIIDLSQQPEFARRDQILAVPTLVKISPEPRMKLVGDMSREDKVLQGLNLT